MKINDRLIGVVMGRKDERKKVAEKMKISFNLARTI